MLYKYGDFELKLEDIIWKWVKENELDVDTADVVMLAADITIDLYCDNGLKIVGDA